MTDTTTITHGALVYTTIALDDCAAKAADLQNAGKKWHSHVLSPGCMNNPYSGRYAAVVEDDSDGVAYVAPSDGFPEVDKDLVRILHGDDILDASKTAEARGAAPPASAMLDRLVALNDNGVAWHHHMNFPDCIFNPHPGKWAITVESEKGVFSEAYEDEPAEILREVEVLYFRNLDAGSGQD